MRTRKAYPAAPPAAVKIQRWLYDESATAKRLKIATVTLQCEREPANNRIKMIQIIDSIMLAHPDVELIMFGEMILGHYNPEGMPAYHREISEPVPGKTTQVLGKLAGKYGIYLCFGMSENDDGHLYNTQVLLNPQGEIQAFHRKWNLKQGEIHTHYQPGNQPVTVTEISGIKTGMIICSDAAHPRTMRELIHNRLELILFSLADDKDEDWFVAKANARLYDAWVVSANRYGQETHYWNGHTVISDPLGKLRLTSTDREGYWVYNIGFAENKSRLKNAVRNLWVKAPLLIHVLTHIKILKSFYA